MLRQLSLRNAKRQSKEYSLFFITLACTVSFMYAFNTLIFSDIIKTFSAAEVLPYMIVAASLLIVLVMGWLVGYMTNFILKKRNRELSIYMLSGIPNRSVSKLIFYENVLIGAFSFLLGLPIGILLSQILEAVIDHMLGISYAFSFYFSWNAAGLTLLYFLAILLHAVRKNRKWMRKINVHDLLLLDRQNEKALASGHASATLIFILSLLSGCAGAYLIIALPLGKGYDILIGIICLTIFLMGFFQSIPAFLVTRFAGRTEWKYRQNRLVTFREFTTKIRSISIVMGVLSVLFMLSLTFMGIGTSIYIIAEQHMEHRVFDVVILHPSELHDFSTYEDTLRRNFPVQSSHTYGIYTDEKKDFLTVRNKAVTEINQLIFAEYRHDTYMKQSDYKRLREMLSYESVPLDPSLCYIHCMPALEKDFRTFIREDIDLSCAGYSFAPDGIFCEPFNQMETYGNGWDYCVIVPDQAVSSMRVLHSLFAAITKSPLDSRDSEHVIQLCDGLVGLERNIAVAASNNEGATSLTEQDADYLSGKWSDKESLMIFYAMAICLFYLALIFEIIGAAILSTQILSDHEKKQRQRHILQQLGMTEKLISKTNNRQFALIFLLPLLPALLISCCFVYAGALKMRSAVFHLTALDNHLWIAKSLGITYIFFLFLYGIYYIFVQEASNR
ncbi:MAG: FtsX-like permease family protein [Lachnospiraceae bacterium]|nr:FtsX-like permease family protein [Lachnospiraceae bacterium]